jgi:peptidoglycan/LPS O-acetylase OafA/YrhL
MTGQSTERLHALDALRGGALLLGIAFHAAFSFVDLEWPVADIDRSSTLFVACFVIHVFRMNVFFVIAGIFARMSFRRRGLGNFVVDRLKRIGIPLVVGWPLLMGAIVAVLMWAEGNWRALPEPVAEKLPVTLGTVPLIHLWFLYALLLLYGGALIVVGLAHETDCRQRLGASTDRFLRAAARTGTAPIVLGAPLFAVFFFHESWIPWVGVHPPDHGLLPNLDASVAYGTAFGFGWLLHRQIELLEVWKRWWPLHLVLAVATTMAALGFYDGTLAGDAPPASLQLAAAAVYPLAIWTWTFALIGLGVAYLSGHSPVRRYLADASYWLYLIHIPIIIAVQVMFAQIPWPWFVKYPAILVISFLPMIASYHFMVRGTAIGALLSGRRYGQGTL